MQITGTDHWSSDYKWNDSKETYSVARILRYDVRLAKKLIRESPRPIVEVPVSGLKSYLPLPPMKDGEPCGVEGCDSKTAHRHMTMCATSWNDDVSGCDPDLPLLMVYERPDPEDGRTTMLLIDGNHRLLRAKKDGREKVGVVLLTAAEGYFISKNVSDRGFFRKWYAEWPEGATKGKAMTTETANETGQTGQMRDMAGAQ